MFPFCSAGCLSRHYCESHLRDVYNGRVYYGKDAFEGLELCEAIIEGRHRRLDAEIEVVWPPVKLPRHESVRSTVVNLSPRRPLRFLMSLPFAARSPPT